MFFRRERISPSSPVELRLSLSIVCSPAIAAAFISWSIAQSGGLRLRRHLFDGLFESIGYLVLLVDPGFLLILVSLSNLLIGAYALFEHAIGHVVPGQTPRANGRGEFFEENRVELAQVLDQALFQPGAPLIKLFILLQESLIPLVRQPVLFDQLFKGLHDFGPDNRRVPAVANSVGHKAAHRLPRRLSPPLSKVDQSPPIVLTRPHSLSLRLQPTLR